VARVDHHCLHGSGVSIRRSLFVTYRSRIHPAPWRSVVLPDGVLHTHVFLPMSGSSEIRKGIDAACERPRDFLGALFSRILLASYPIPRMKKSPNQTLEQNCRPASPLGRWRQFGRAVRARPCVSGGSRSALR
jgi:hypothetical protein